jgi:hypothetical protein
VSTRPARETTAPDARTGARRLAQNEALFCDANELFLREAERDSGHRWRFICECSSAGCLERIELTRAEYERARPRAEWFLVASGHDDPSLERIVERHQTFYLVEKRGIARQVAQAENPR